MKMSRIAGRGSKISRCMQQCFLGYLLCASRMALGFAPGDETTAVPTGRWQGLSAKSQQVSAAQLQAIGTAQKSGLHIEQARQSGLPVMVRGKGLNASAMKAGAFPALQVPQVNAARAVEVLKRVSTVFSIKDAASEFSLRKRDDEPNGFSHLRMAQYYEELEVVGGEMVVHFDAKGAAYQVDGKYISVALSDTAPTVLAAKANMIAAGIVKDPPVGLSASSNKLVVWGMGDSPHLAYQIELTAPGARWRVWVDAKTGEVLLAYDNRHKISAPTSSGANVTITGSLLSGEGGGAVSVTGWHEQGGAYYLYNKVSNLFVYNVAVSGYSDNGTYAYRNSSAWGTSDRTEISAVRNFELTQQYFVNRHGRNSFDGAGADARINVHEGVDYVNAYWDGSDFHFGDGDAVVAYPLSVLDVAAHEFTHAVTENTANLTYYGESGALNESFSDIFGACVEFYGQSDGRDLYPSVQSGSSDWLMGEDCWIASKSLRDMRNPRNTGTVGGDGVQPSRYRGTYWYFGTGDNGGVHVNSGVQNFMFYLLCEGGTGDNDGTAYALTGLGISNAERIAYRALTVYCNANTDYAGARVAWMSAAEDLDSSWVSSVEAAWTAVGVSGSTSGSNDTWDPADNAGTGATTLAITSAVQQHGPHTLSNSDLYDWFKVYLEAGTPNTFHTQGSSGDNYGELYSDSAGTSRVAYNDDGGGDLQFLITYTPSSSGWYYLRVRGYSTGSSLQYELNYQGGQGSTTTDLGASLDAESVNWSTGGTLPWTGQSAVTHDGSDAAQSGAIGHGQTTWFEATLQGPGTLSFWWRVSSESGYDYQRFSVNATDEFVRSGEGAWEEKTVSLSAGPQVVRWTYSKDGSVSSGSDSAWVDQVVWEPGDVMSPAGGEVVTNQRTPFSWPARAGATRYQIWINRNGETYWSPAEQSATSWIPTSDLLPASYRWWVRPWSATSGYGDWSVPADFSVAYSRPVVAPILYSPAGTVTELTPTFAWGAVARAAWYRIYVSRDGQPYLDHWVSGTTRYTPAASMPSGSYQWWGVGWGPDGYGPWSNAKSFYIPRRIPREIIQTAPQGSQSGTYVTYRWQKDAYATWYQLMVRGDSGTWHDSWYSGEGSGEASVTLANHPEGNLAWWIRAWGPEGMGPWSGAMAFSTPRIAPSKPVLSSPAGGLSNSRPLFRWDSATQASWYRLFVNRGATTVIDRWTTSTSLDSPVTLAAGTHTWWVGAWNESSGQTVWSSPLNVDVGTVGYYYNISLTWGLTPYDLDSYLVTPLGTRIYGGSMGARDTHPYAALDVDDTNGYGPEPIGVYGAYSGTYKYYVNNFSGSPALAGSGARVRLVNAAGSVLLDQVAPSVGNGEYWYVFDMIMSTGQITVRNVIQTYEP